MSKGRWFKLAMMGVCVTAVHAAAAPQYDHVVIVVEENHSFNQIIDNPDAAYINQLAAGGALMTNFFGITHPSQPNYLQFFSGSNQGATSNTTPASLPFTASNLGGALLQAGRTFTGYSQTLPSVGFNGDSFTTVPGENQYVRKHNPWVNWQAATPTGFQLPLATNRPFTDFPSDFTQLPTISIVVPDEQNDMHDGTIAQADQWLQSNLGAYASWAQAHNSLLIVTWDEDNSANRNRIPTLFYGAKVQPGAYNAAGTLHNLLRTVQEMYDTSYSGSAANVRSIVGPFVTDPQTVIRTFRQGEAGYSGAHDTYIEAANPAATHGSSTPDVVDGSPLSQGLIRFDSLFGGAANQVPAGAKILSAKLSMLSSDSSADQFAIHPMLVNWSEASTWNSFTAGVDLNNLEASATADFTLLPNVIGDYAIFDVTSTLQQWANGTLTNNGWVIVDKTGTDGWRWHSAEAATIADRPILEIVYELPGLPGDFNHDNLVDAADIDLLYDLFAPSHAGIFDLDGDGDADAADVQYLLTNILHRRFGDADLDGDVDAADLSILRNHLGATGAGWATADFDGDGDVDAADLSLLRNNLGLGPPGFSFGDTISVPEPGSGMMLLFTLAAVRCGKRLQRV